MTPMTVLAFVVFSAHADGGASAGVPAPRLEMLRTGANVCRWFRFPAATTDAHFESYITNEEMGVMRQMGLRHVRLCVSPDVIMTDAGMTKEREMAFVEKAVKRFIASGIGVVLDIHNENRPRIEDNKAWQDGFVSFWSATAKRFSTVDPERLVLEIVNEPVFDGREAEWFGLQDRLVTAIRQAAPKHTIMATGANWGGIWGLQKLTPVKDSNVVYSFHCYDPFPFTHQAATWSSEEVKPLKNVPYPSSPEAVAPLLAGLPERSAAMLKSYGEERWNREKMASNFRQAIDWGKKHNVPLYCGEFGVFPVAAQAEHRANWFRDFGGVLSENGVGWAVWGWDEGFGLNRQVRNGKIEVDPVVAKALGLKVVP